MVETSITTTAAGFIQRMEAFEMPSYVYTYPPKGAAVRFADRSKVKASWRDLSGPLALYVHVPFCNIKCTFCQLFQSTNHDDDLRAKYVSALKDELRIVTSLMKRAEVEIKSIYFGGGTPTLLSSGQLRELLYYFYSIFRVAKDSEVSIESTPDAVDDSRCRELLDIGFNRISFGVQTFDSSELKAVGRHYGAEMGAQATTTALDAGFPNANLDLIYGLPGQTFEVWKSNVRRAIEVGPPTITLYPLVVRSRTAFGKQQAADPDRFSSNELRYRCYDVALEMLEAAGYVQHTLVTFARDGGGNIHEANEFVGIPTLGLGAGARSYAPNLHYANDDYFQRKSPAVVIREYLKAIGQSDLAVRSAIMIEPKDLLRRYVILGLLYLGVSSRQYRKKFGTSIHEDFAIEFDVLEKAGCLEMHADCVKLTSIGKRFSSLIADFLTSEGIRKRASAYR